MQRLSVSVRHVVVPFSVFLQIEINVRVHAAQFNTCGEYKRLI